MLEIRPRSLPRARVVWFADEAASPRGMSRLTTYDLRFKQAREKPGDRHNKQTEVFPFDTLLTDLTADPSRLWTAISPTTRNYVNAATAKLAYEITYFDGNPPAACYEFLARFSAQRGLWTPSPSYYKKHLEHGTVSRARLDGETAVLHFYLHDPEARRVHLLWSARSLNGTDRPHELAVSKLNRLLHWQDLLYFKNQGFETYDWGGITPGDPAMRGVDDFKRQFGGVHVREWEVAWRSPLYAPLRKLVRSLKGGTVRRPGPTKTGPHRTAQPAQTGP